MRDKPSSYPHHPTNRLPRAQLAPIAPAPSVEEPPETRPALAETKARAREAEDSIITLVPCPGCDGSKSRPCASCRGSGMVAPTRKSAIETEVTCPLCCGGGKVAPEIATTFDELTTNRKDRA